MARHEDELPLSEGLFLAFADLSLGYKNSNGRGVGPRTKMLHLDYASYQARSTPFPANAQNHMGYGSARSSDCGVTHLHRTPTPDPHQTFRPNKFLAAIYQADLRRRWQSELPMWWKALPLEKCVCLGENAEKEPLGHPRCWGKPRGVVGLGFGSKCLTKCSPRTFSVPTELAAQGTAGDPDRVIERLWVFGLYVVFYPTASPVKLHDHLDHNQLVVTQF